MAFLNFVYWPPDLSRCRSIAMKALHLQAVGAAMSALLVLADTPAAAQSGGGFTLLPLPPRPHGGMHGIHGPFFIVERETIIEREVVREKPAAPPAPVEPPPPRKPYVLGKTYASLPDGCMKMIEQGASYYYCSGDWYRQVGSAEYKAVLQPL